MKSHPALRSHTIPHPQRQHRSRRPSPPEYSSTPAPAFRLVFHSTVRGFQVPPVHCAPPLQKFLPRYSRLSTPHPLPLSSFPATPHPCNATAIQGPRSRPESLSK